MECVPMLYHSIVNNGWMMIAAFLAMVIFIGVVGAVGFIWRATFQGQR